MKWNAMFSPVKSMTEAEDKEFMEHVMQLINDDYLCPNLLQPLISGLLPAENHPFSISCGHQRPSC